jgi:leucyl aminopeptidase (aminopeptidase T)
MHGAEAALYIDALAYDRDYYRGVGGALKAGIDRARRAVVDSGGERLVYASRLEPAKLNVGDYAGMQHVGGQYPIGEVFTEAQDLDAVSGRVRIAFFGDTAFTVNRPDRPITLIVEQGRVTGTVDSTPELERVLELGFGLNRALTPERTVSDIGTFERMCGVHLSLGAKHASYAKPAVDKRRARHHVDVFVRTESVALDGETIYRDGAWRVEPVSPA